MIAIARQAAPRLAQPEPVEGPARTSAVTQCWICRYNPALCGRNARKGAGRVIRPGAGGMSGGSCGGRFTASLRQTLPSILRFRRHCTGEEGAPRADRLPLAFGPWTDASRKPPSPDPPTPGICERPVPRSRTGQIWCGGGVVNNLFGF